MVRFVNNRAEIALHANEDGSIMPIFAISLLAIIALVGATLALSMDSRAANQVQHTTDAAALGGAVAFINIDTAKLEDRKQAALLQADVLAKQNTELALVRVETIAASEDEYGQYLQMSVDVEFKPTNAAAGMTGRNANVAISGRAVADATWGFPLCLLSLSTTGESFTTSDNASFHAQDCIIWSNSTDSRSLNFTGGSVRSKSTCTAGGAFGGMRAHPSPATQCRQIADPLAGWKPPQPGKCPALSGTPTRNSSLLASELNKYLKHEFEITEFLEETRKLALVLEHLNIGNWTSQGKNSLLSVSASIPSIADIQVELGGYSNVNQYLRDHPYFALTPQYISFDGVLREGEAKGLTLNELAQISGLIDNMDPDLYSGDTYYNMPTTKLTPGTYCGLDVGEGHVELAPGTYFIKDGPLTVRRRGTLSGEGVTIIMSGENAYFGVMDEARLNLKAPIEGSLAGFALVEDKAPKYSGTALSFSNLPQLSSQARPRSRLTGSGAIDAIGTIYLPRHDFHVTGDGAGDQTSPLLQIVANTVRMSDNGEIKIKFDPDKTLVPAGIKPERTARLIE